MSDITIRSAGAVTEKFIKLASENVDLLRSTGYIASENAGREWVEMTQTGTPVWGQTLYWLLNTGAGAGFCGDQYLRIVLPAPAAGNYSSNPGFDAIGRVVVRHGGQTVMDYDYKLVMQLLLKTMEPDRAQALLYGANLGDSTPGAATYFAPIPTFWSRLLAFREGFVKPLALNALNGELSIEITLNSAAGMTASGATVTANPTSITLVYEKMYDGNYNVGNSDPNIYKSISWLTEKGVSTAASGVSTSLNFTTFQGHLTKLLVAPMLVSDVDTAHNYFTSQSISYLELSVNGKLYLRQSDTTTGAESLIRSILFVDENMGNPLIGAGAASLGIPVLIPFSLDCNSPFSYTGSLNTLSNNSPLGLLITQTNGAACYIYMIAEIDVIYEIKNGILTANK